MSKPDFIPNFPGWRALREDEAVTAECKLVATDGQGAYKYPNTGWPCAGCSFLGQWAGDAHVERFADRYWPYIKGDEAGYRFPPNKHHSSPLPLP